MQLTSVNVASPQKLQIGKRETLTGIYKSAVGDYVTVTQLGLHSDAILNTKHHGGEDQAVYLYSAADYAWWGEQLGKEIAPGTFGENLTLSAYGEEPLRVGDQFIINDVILEATAPRIPCDKLAARMGDPTFVKRFADAKRPGVYTRVLQTGTIRAGDSVKYFPADPNNVTIIELHDLFLAKDKDETLMRKALDAPVAERARAALEEWLA